MKCTYSHFGHIFRSVNIVAKFCVENVFFLNSVSLAGFDLTTRKFQSPQAEAIPLHRPCRQGLRGKCLQIYYIDPLWNKYMLT
jgi:hypothetical protein